MKKLIVIGICLVLLGVMVMPAEAYNFTIRLDHPEDEANASVYLEGKFVGKADKNGFFVFNIDNLERDKKYNVTVKKDGYKDLAITVYNAGCDNGIITGMQKSLPAPTPEQTIITATPPPATPNPLEQRITDLEQQTQDQETKLSWLMNKVEAIIAFLRGKGFTG